MYSKTEFIKDFDEWSYIYDETKGSRGNSALVTKLIALSTRSILKAIYLAQTK